MEQHQLDKKNNQGFVTMILVTVVSAVGIFIALSIFANSNLYSKTISASESGQKAQALASACIEDGLEKVREDTSVSGNYNLTFTEGSCSYSITNTSPTDIDIHAEGVFNEYERTIDVSITETDPQIIVNSWTEGL